MVGKLYIGLTTYATDFHIYTEKYIYHRKNIIVVKNYDNIGCFCNLKFGKIIHAKYWDKSNKWTTKSQ